MVQVFTQSDVDIYTYCSKTTTTTTIKAATQAFVNHHNMPQIFTIPYTAVAQFKQKTNKETNIEMSEFDEKFN